MPITYDDFKKSYPKVKSMHLFTWINNLISGFQPKDMNLDPENEVKGYERRLSVQQRERQNAALSSSVA